MEEGFDFAAGGLEVEGVVCGDGFVVFDEEGLNETAGDVGEFAAAHGAFVLDLDDLFDAWLVLGVMGDHS